MLTKTTLTIMRARIAQLTHEVGVLRRENERLREVLKAIDAEATRQRRENERLNQKNKRLHHKNYNLRTALEANGISQIQTEPVKDIWHS